MEEFRTGFIGLCAKGTQHFQFDISFSILLDIRIGDLKIQVQGNILVLIRSLNSFGKGDMILTVIFFACNAEDLVDALTVCSQGDRQLGVRLIDHELVGRSRALCDRGLHLCRRIIH